jgi:hypothetical protein
MNETLSHPSMVDPVVIGGILMPEPPTICLRKDRNFRYCTEKCPDITKESDGNHDVYKCNYHHTKVIPTTQYLAARKRIHELKCHPEPYGEAWGNQKTFEFRKNDRNFGLYDILVLREFDPLTGYTGRYLLRTVTYVLRRGFGLPDGYCIMSMRPLTEEEEANHAAGTIPALSA